jgi:hypothetical protein
MNNKDNQKRGWAPVWIGLVMDPKSTHYTRMNNAVWLYLYLLLNADRKTGWLKRKVTTICEDTGISERTIRRWLATLAGQKYIEIKFTGRCLNIQISKWKGSALPTLATQSCHIWQGSLANFGNPEGPGFIEKRQNSCAEILFSPVANDISIKRDILKTDIDRGNESNPGVFEGFTPEFGKAHLAMHLAKELNDRQGFPLYLAYSRKYPESLLRSVLQKVKAMPDDKIKKSRGALFNDYRK